MFSRGGQTSRNLEEKDVSASGIQEKDVALFLTSSQDSVRFESRADDIFQQRKTQNELDMLFGLPIFVGTDTSVRRLRRPVIDTREAHEQRQELLYKSVIRIFEIQLQQEQREAEIPRSRMLLQGPSLGKSVRLYNQDNEKTTTPQVPNGSISKTDLIEKGKSILPRITLPSLSTAFQNVGHRKPSN